MDTVSLPPSPATVLCTLDLRTETHPPRHARSALRDVLRRHTRVRLSPEQMEAAVLVVSELVTNACRHTPGPVELRVLWRASHLVVQVEDRSPAIPAVTPCEGRGDCGGYGLLLVEELTDNWTVETGPCGKTVEVTLRRELG
ncbi:ATP-binding protein [Streptomyces sp. NPDC057101]|uniref:ATP-binding protein n=1 Tax=Streptomyces sp. NPDC057101 TaxID=3346020 RepID=UPI00362C9007